MKGNSVEPTMHPVRLPAVVALTVLLAFCSVQGMFALTLDQWMLEGGCAWYSSTSIVDRSSIGQEFRAGLPILQGVEVKLVTLDDEAGDDTITLTVRKSTITGPIIATASKYVVQGEYEGDEQWVYFALDAVSVTPEYAIYVIRLQATKATFGWEYNPDDFSYLRGARIEDGSMREGNFCFRTYGSGTMPTTVSSTVNTTVIDSTSCTTTVFVTSSSTATTSETSTTTTTVNPVSVTRTSWTTRTVIGTIPGSATSIQTSVLTTSTSVSSLSQQSSSSASTETFIPVTSTESSIIGTITETSLTTSTITGETDTVLLDETDTVHAYLLLVYNELHTFVEHVAIFFTDIFRQEETPLGVQLNDIVVTELYRTTVSSTVSTTVIDSISTVYSTHYSLSTVATTTSTALVTSTTTADGTITEYVTETDTVYAYLLTMLERLQAAIPEYPLGLASLAAFMTIAYGLIRRRTVAKKRPVEN